MDWTVVQTAACFIVNGCPLLGLSAWLEISVSAAAKEVAAHCTLLVCNCTMKMVKGIVWHTCTIGISFSWCLNTFQLHAIAFTGGKCIDELSSELGCRCVLACVCVIREREIHNTCTCKCEKSSLFLHSLVRMPLPCVLADGWNSESHPCQAQGYGVWELRLPPTSDGKPPVPHGSKVKVRLGYPPPPSQAAIFPKQLLCCLCWLSFFFWKQIWFIKSGLWEY